MPHEELDFAPIAKMFADRDREIARQRQVSGLDSRGVYSASSVRVNTPKPQVRNSQALERIPRNDEFRRISSKKAAARNKAALQKAKQRRAAQTSTAVVPRQRGGAYLAKRSNQPLIFNKKVLGPVAALGAALLIFFGAKALINSDNKGNDTDVNPSPAVSFEAYDDSVDGNDAIVVGGHEYTLDEPESLFPEEQTPVETEAPYVPVEHASDAMIDYLKGFEDLRLEAYKCPSGKWTIGYGHTQGVKPGDTVTKAEAEAIFREDLVYYENVVKNYADKVGAKLTQGQLDALVSFCYNCGEGTFRSSGITELLAEGDIEAAAELQNKYVYGRDKNGDPVKLVGLESRRHVETSWYVNGD